VQRIDEVVLDQRLSELRAAMHDDVPLVPLLELGDLVDHVAFQHRRVIPLGVLQRGVTHAVEGATVDSNGCGLKAPTRHVPMTTASLPRREHRILVA
jgi:hypothetical protein